jgi:hypothetical protein
MSIIGISALVVGALLLVGIVNGSAASGCGAYDEDDPNQFVKDELDPSNPNNLMLRNHHDDDCDDFHVHAHNLDED